jgi:hypothetical protein
MSAIISPSSMGLRGTEDTKVGCEVVEMSEFQSPFRHQLSLRHSSEFSLKMGDSEVKV